MNWINLIYWFTRFPPKQCNDRSCWPGLLNLEWGLNFSYLKELLNSVQQVKHCCILFKHYVRPRDLVNLAVAAYKSYCKFCIFPCIYSLLCHSYHYFKISYSKGDLKYWRIFTLPKKGVENNLKLLHGIDKLHILKKFAFTGLFVFRFYK